MSPTEQRQAARALIIILRVLVVSAGNPAGQAGANLRRLAGALAADATTRVEAGDYGPDLAACFEAATAAGATFDAMIRVQQCCLSFPSTLAAVNRVTQTSLRYALVQISLILAATTFTSRTQVDDALALVTAAFEAAELFAANQKTTGVWVSLVTLRSTVVRDLTQRARPLPAMVTFNLGPRLPALVIAQRLYADASREGELIQENAVVHPLFMLGSGQALAS